jgi:hypothetical protein
MADFRVINGAPLANRHRGQANGARPMKTASILFLFLLAIAAPQGASAANENDTTFYTEYIPKGFPAVRDNPSETRSEITLKNCRERAARDSFTLYIFEADALRKFERFGAAGLDADDRKWVSAHDNRKAACLAFTKANGGGGYLEQAKAWLREWLK